jgi:site-specific recombinase XerD/ribosomal protein L37E
MSDLKSMAIWMKKDFRTATIDDLKTLVRKIEQMPYKASTKRDFKITLRKFYRFLKNTEETPEELKWMKIQEKKSDRKLPEEMLTEEEIKRMISVADNPRDKAFIAVLYETGCRFGEIISLRIKHARFDDHGGILMVDGKTGARRVRIVSSVPYLTAWINEHNGKDNPEAFLWTKRRGHGLIPNSYGGVRSLLTKLQTKARITKSVHPHNFRHSRATYLANHLTEAQMKEYFGWVQASEMASVYVHLSGRDIDTAILKTYGLQTENNGKQESILKPLACQRCSESNPSNNKFCLRCGFPLDEQERLRQFESSLKRSEADRIMDVLIKDDEFRSMLERKLKELILTQ